MSCYSCLSNGEFARPAKDKLRDTLRIIFVGDIMVAHDRKPANSSNAASIHSSPVPALLKNADIAIGNLECVVAKKASG